MSLPAAGDAVFVAGITANNVAGGSWSASDSRGNSYSITNRNGVPTGTNTLVMFESILTTGLLNNDQITLSQSFGSIKVLAAAFWGKLVTAKDTSNDNNAFGSGPAAPALTLATADELAFYLFGWDDGTVGLTIPAGYNNSGFTNPFTLVDGATTLRMAACWSEQTTSGSYTPPAGTLSNNADWAAEIAVTKALGGTTAVELGSNTATGSSVSVTVSSGGGPSGPHGFVPIVTRQAPIRSRI